MNDLKDHAQFRRIVRSILKESVWDSNFSPANSNIELMWQRFLETLDIRALLINLNSTLLTKNVSLIGFHSQDFSDKMPGEWDEITDRFLQWTHENFKLEFSIVVTDSKENTKPKEDQISFTVQELKKIIKAGNWGEITHINRDYAQGYVADTMTTIVIKTTVTPEMMIKKLNLSAQSMTYSGDISDDFYNE